MIFLTMKLLRNLIKFDRQFQIRIFNMKTKLTTFCLLFLLLISCNDDEPEKTISPTAKVYLNQVLDIMEKNSINKHQIKWDYFRTEVFNTVPAAQTIGDTYAGISKAFTLLGDNHSFFRTPNGNTIRGNSSVVIQLENIDNPTIPNDIGYVKVTYFSGSANDALAITFAKQIQNQIKQQDLPDLKGWIVDLRNNTGGNMWPMLAGIGPVLGEGTAGYFIDADGNAVEWGFQNGASVYYGNQVTQLNNSYNLLTSNPKVAVLLNSAVASSGEAIAVSFIGRKNTKSFGSATAGLSTSNQSFTLSDNAILYLTTAFFADRNKNIYGSTLNPDVTSSKETIIGDAITWIRE